MGILQRRVVLYAADIGYLKDLWGDKFTRAAGYATWFNPNFFHKNL
jgi:hypothetical protein